MKNPVLKELDHEFQIILEELKKILPPDKEEMIITRLLQYNHIIHNLVARTEQIQTVLYHAESDLNHNLTQLTRLRSPITKS